MNTLAAFLMDSPARNGGRGLKLINQHGILSDDDDSPARNGGRGLKQSLMSGVMGTRWIRPPEMEGVD